MDLLRFKTIDDTIKVTRTVAVACCAVMGIAFTASFLHLSRSVDEAYSRTLILDTSGNVYDVTRVDQSRSRPLEYRAHVRDFVSLWYAFDESTYEGNIKRGLSLVGDKGKELLNEYNSVSMFNSLMQKNIRYSVAITDISVDDGTIPVSGKIRFTQTGYRARGSISREIEARFTLYDVSRSDDNTRGVKIGEWEVSYSEPRTADDVTNPRMEGDGDD